jgi:hypothetical protein
MRYLIIITLLSINCFSFSQDNNKDINLYLKLHPSTLINIYRPTIQVSSEVELFDKVGFECTYGLRYFDLDFDTLTIIPKGYNIRFELKYYKIFKDVENLCDYFSIGYWYVDDKRNDKLRYYNENSIVITDYFGMVQKINVYVATYGLICNYKRLLFEGSLGIGFRHAIVSWIDCSYDKTKHVPYGDLWSWEYPGEKNYFHLNVNFKIGYKLF